MTGLGRSPWRFLGVACPPLWYKNYTVTDQAMRLRWDSAKQQHVLTRRNINFAVLTELMCAPYLEDVRNDDPEQFRIIGFADGRLLTFIVEYREDDLGDYIWVVTAWESTKQERRAYGHIQAGY